MLHCNCEKFTKQSSPKHQLFYIGRQLLFPFVPKNDFYGWCLHCMYVVVECSMTLWPKDTGLGLLERCPLRTMSRNASVLIQRQGRKVSSPHTERAITTKIPYSYVTTAFGEGLATTLSILNMYKIHDLGLLQRLWLPVERRSRVGFGGYDWRVELVNRDGTRKRFPKTDKTSTSNHRHVPALPSSYFNHPLPQIFSLPRFSKPSSDYTGRYGGAPLQP